MKDSGYYAANGQWIPFSRRDIPRHRPTGNNAPVKLMTDEDARWSAAQNVGAIGLRKLLLDWWT
jgi:hypothetical protein